MLKSIINDKERFKGQSLIQPGSDKTDNYFLPPADNRLLDGFSNRPEIVPGGTRFFQKRRKRLVVKKGIDNVTLLLEHIVLFHYENRITYAIDHLGAKYKAETNLAGIERELDNTLFFRANRQFIININYIKSFRNYERVKLKVDLNPEDINSKHDIIISQERSAVFKEWIFSA